jgi:hypothetical protein
MANYASRFTLVAQKLPLDHGEVFSSTLRCPSGIPFISQGGDLVIYFFLWFILQHGQ